jgi:hypothetical protein
LRFNIIQINTVQSVRISDLFSDIMAACSYWKSYRTVRSKVTEHLNYIYSDDQAQTDSDTDRPSTDATEIQTDQSESSSRHLQNRYVDISADATNFIDENSALNEHPAEILNIGCVNEITPECSSVYDNSDCSAAMEFEDYDEGDDNEYDNDLGDSLATYTIDDSGDNSDCSTTENSPDDLANELRGWANKFNIPHNATRDLLGLLHDYHPQLPKDPRTLLKTPSVYDVKEVNGGSYHHFGITECIRKELLCNGNISISEVFSLSLQINIDGLPLFKSSSIQFWPILGRLITPYTSKPFIIGLFVGDQKPGNIEEFLHDFVTEIGILKELGLQIPGVPHTIDFTISCIICDTPAKAYVKQTKGHSGYYGCDKCSQRGEWKGKMTFPQTNAPLRTDAAFDQMQQAEHHNGLSPLKNHLGMVSQFPIDYMHLVCLGVVKRMISLWIKGPLHCRQGNAVISQISAKLLDLRSHLPREFLRKGRSLKEVDRWKATEFRLFLLYTGPVILNGCIPSLLYDNFLLLFVGIFCLSSPFFCTAYNQYANELLGVFVQQFGRLYGEDQFVYNIHGLTHLAGDVLQFGTLDTYSSFVFESFLGKLKRLVRKPNFPLQQVIRRVAEMQSLAADDTKPICGIVRKEHGNGPVTRDFRFYSQYRELSLPDIYLSVNRGDNCVLIGDKVGLVRNILCERGESEKILMVELFRESVSFFESPLSSSDLRIFIVSRPNEQMIAVRVTDISSKCVLLPYKTSFVAFPLLHNFV